MLSVRMLFIHILLWKKFVNNTKHPRKIQTELLRSILIKQRNTQYAKEHCFGVINNYKSYADLVPIQSYEDLEPYIKEQEIRKSKIINIENPIFYAQTSGTSGKPKLLPILNSTIKRYKKNQSIVAYAYYRYCRNIYKGKVLAIVSPAIEGRLESGRLYGSMSGLVQQSMPKLMHQKYVVPTKVFELSNYDAKYYYICVFALSSDDISLIATANPSTLLKIDQTIKKHQQQMINDIKTGVLSNSFKIDSNKLNDINQYFKQNTVRAIELGGILKEQQQLTIQALWPNLKAVSTWTHGNAGTLISKIRAMLPKSTRILELGYLASEFRGSININPKYNQCIPTIHENFFEFISVNSYQTDHEQCHLINEIESGKQYYVVITTGEGLYRYFMNDIVEVDGFYNQTPIIKFMQKGQGVISLTGEKLYENQVIDAIQNLESQLPISSNFFLMLGDMESLSYTLYIATNPIDDSILINQFEKNISTLNIEFDVKRKSGRLKKTQVIFLDQYVYEAYKKHCIKGGQREGQFKHVVLQKREDLTFNFNHHIIKSV